MVARRAADSACPSGAAVTLVSMVPNAEKQSDPNQVLVFANGKVFRSANGGKTHESWSLPFDRGWVTTTQPIVGLPMPQSRWRAARAAIFRYDRAR
jgi:hypothetical protein